MKTVAKEVMEVYKFEAKTFLNGHLAKNKSTSTAILCR